MKKRYIIITIIAVIIVLAIGAAVFIVSRAKDGQNILQNIQSTIKGVPACGEGMELFSVAPVDLDNLSGLVPLGNLAPPSHTFPTDHMYFNIPKQGDDPNDWEQPSRIVPVYAPGDIWLTSISSQQAEAPHTGQMRTDYQLRFTPCREVTAYYIHINELSPKLTEAFEKESSGSCSEYETGGRVYKNCDASVNMKLSAGEEIGQVGGDNSSGNFDLGVHDTRSEPLVFANQDRWFGQTPYIVCPLDYFTPTVKAGLEAKLGEGSGGKRRTVEPVCGQIDQDIAGTAQGVWFVAGTPDGAEASHPEDPHLALVHDNVDPTLGVFSIGNSIGEAGLPSGLYKFTPQSGGSVNTDFPDLATGEVYCYENFVGNGNNPVAGQVILVELVDDENLRIGGQGRNSCGAGPWSLDQYVEFVR